jgi:hypothetical protein
VGVGRDPGVNKDPRSFIASWGVVVSGEMEIAAEVEGMGVGHGLDMDSGFGGWLWCCLYVSIGDS